MKHGTKTTSDVKCINRGYLLDKHQKIDSGMFIGAVRDGPDDGKRDAEFKTHLGNCRAFHFHCKQIGKMLLQFLYSRGAVDEFVATRNQSAMHLWIFKTKNLALVVWNFRSQIVSEKLSRCPGKQCA